MSELRPYINAAVRIPSEIVLEIDSNILTIKFDTKWSIREINDYINLTHTLRVNNIDENIVS